jgi:hypothetical protein
MYKQTETTKKIIMFNSGNIISPIVTLKDEHGGICQIINDDHCYVICLKKEDGTYSPTTHIFKEVFNVLKGLPEPL